MKKTAPKGLSSTELRALRDQKLAAPYEAQEASRREQSFLRHLGSAQEDFDWIVEHQAWVQLGHDSFASWYLGKVKPAIEALGAQPTRELSAKVFERIRAEEEALPKPQRRSTKQLADVVGLSEWKAEGRKDHRRRGSTANDDLENSGGADSSPIGVPGLDPPAGSEGEIQSEDVALVASQPGSQISSTEASVSVGAPAEPPVPDVLVGEVPIASDQPGIDHPFGSAGEAAAATPVAPGAAASEPPEEPATFSDELEGSAEPPVLPSGDPDPDDPAADWISTLRWLDYAAAEVLKDLSERDLVEAGERIDNLRRVLFGIT